MKAKPQKHIRILTMSDKQKNQGTDSWNPSNGVDALGPTMRPTPAADVAVPASKEFNGAEFDSFDSQQSTSK